MSTDMEAKLVVLTCLACNGKGNCTRCKNKRRTYWVNRKHFPYDAMGERAAWAEIEAMAEAQNERG